MYVTSETVPAIRVSAAAFVTEPDARFVTGASIVRASVTVIAKPALVVSADPLEERDSLDLIVPIGFLVY